MDVLSTDGAGAPTRWMLIFRRRAAQRWVNWLVPGEFKHVAAFAYVAEVDAYVFYDVWLGGTAVHLARGAGARAVMTAWTKGATVLAMDALPHRLSFGLFCTGAVSRLLGIGCALLPTTLYRKCLANGAVVVNACGPAAAGPEPDSAAGTG